MSSEKEAAASALAHRRRLVRIQSTSTMDLLEAVGTLRAWLDGRWLPPAQFRAAVQSVVDAADHAPGAETAREDTTPVESSQIPEKRGRGRPRKEPAQEAVDREPGFTHKGEYVSTARGDYVTYAADLYETEEAWVSSSERFLKADHGFNEGRTLRLDLKSVIPR